VIPDPQAGEAPGRRALTGAVASAQRPGARRPRRRGRPPPGRAPGAAVPQSACRGAPGARARRGRGRSPPGPSRSGSSSRPRTCRTLRKKNCCGHLPSDSSAERRGGPARRACPCARRSAAVRPGVNLSVAASRTQARGRARGRRGSVARQRVGRARGQSARSVASSSSKASRAPARSSSQPTGPPRQGRRVLEQRPAGRAAPAPARATSRR
jgi:hypothetical protein